jgi:hypothetical protein
MARYCKECGLERFDLPVFVKRHWYLLAAGGLIACAVAVRLALVLIGWPHTNSEEGTMGLEALHILQRGERPVYLYGQNYMGTAEAYLGALAFRIFGVSLVALRLGMIAFYALFLAGVFWTTHLLYSRRVALVSLAVLIVGTPFVMQIDLLADGGKAETLAFGALLFALASWLVLARPADPMARGQRARRAAAFAAWGVIAGLGLYTYAIIAPFVLTSGLLLWLTCRRELRGWAMALSGAGLLIGLLPAILSTATMPAGDNPVVVFLSLHQSLNAQGSSGSGTLLKQVIGTLLYTLPTVTGLVNLYPVEALPLYGPPGFATVVAVVAGGGWSLGYVALLGVATSRPWRALQRARRSRAAKSGDSHAQTESTENARLGAETARDLARLLLPLAGWLTIAAYLFSATAANNPHSGRYMIALLVILPTVLWPLVDRITPVHRGTGVTHRRGWRRFVHAAWRPVGVALLGVSLLLAVIGTAQAVPGALVADQKDARFAHELLDHGITRFYSDYWTCDLMTFATREQLICAVVGANGQPGLTRYAPYYAAVRADPNAPYVLSRGSPEERAFLMHALATRQYYDVKYVFGRYRVYVRVTP